MFGIPIALSDDGHDLIVSLLNTRFSDLYWWFTVILTLLFGSFIFSAGGYLYTHVVSLRLDKFMNNHMAHLEQRVQRLLRHNGLSDDGEDE